MPYTSVISGFNGFSQLNPFYLKNQPTQNRPGLFLDSFLETQHSKEILSAHIHWATSLLIFKDGLIVVEGFINNSTQSIKLRCPSGQPVKGAVSKDHCFLINSQGECWKYTFSSSQWSCLNQLIQREKDNKTETLLEIVNISLGETLSVVLNKTGVVYNPFTALTPPQLKVKEVECGREHGILLTYSSQVYTWGGGSRGQLGNGGLESSESPIEVPALSGVRVKEIAAGGWHSCALSEDGDLYTWGWNRQGQLGHPRLQDSTSRNQGAGVAVLGDPRPVDFPPEIEESVTVSKVACGASHTVVVLSNNEVWGCGWNKWGQLGLPHLNKTSSMVKLALSGEYKIESIICGAWNTLLLVT